MHEDTLWCTMCEKMIDIQKTRAYPCHRCRKVSYCSHKCYKANKKQHYAQCRGSRKALRRRASTGSIKDVFSNELENNAQLIESLYRDFCAGWAEHGKGALVLWINNVVELQSLILKQNQVDTRWFTFTPVKMLENRENVFAELLQMIDTFNHDEDQNTFICSLAIGPSMCYNFCVRDACPTPR